MKRFIEGDARRQGTLLPELLEDYVAENNPVRIVDVFVDELDLGKLGFESLRPARTGRPAYHPAVLLKLYIWATSIVSNRAGGSNAKHSVTLNSCG